MTSNRIAAGYSAARDRLKEAMKHNHGNYLPDGYVPVRRGDANAFLELIQKGTMWEAGNISNTDREVWRAPAEAGLEAYADSVKITAEGLVALCRGGFCIQGTVAEWHSWFACHPDHQPVKAEGEPINGKPISIHGEAIHTELPSNLGRLTHPDDIEQGASEEARYILGKLLPEWTALFLSKNKGYRNVESLGLRGYFVDLNRKIGKLKSVWWEGERLDHEGDREVALDMIGHLLLAIAWADNNIDGYRPEGSLTGPTESGSGWTNGAVFAPLTHERYENDGAWDALPPKIQDALRALAYGHEVVSTPSLRQVTNDFIPPKGIF